MPDAAATLALVTGASSGIGFGLARCFARDHRALAITARDPEALQLAAVQLAKPVVPSVVERKAGRISITASLAAHTSSPDLTVYSATQSFLHTFAGGLGGELKGTGVTATALLPDATEPRFFERAGMAETKIGSGNTAPAAEVAAAGYAAMMRGENYVVAPTTLKLTAALANVLPDRLVASLAKAQ